MAKNSGGTKTSGASKASPANSVAIATPKIDNSKVKIPFMPGKYKSAAFTTNEGTYTISHIPTASGKSGRFTLSKPDGDYHDFNYGPVYGGNISSKEAYNNLKAWVKKFYL